MGGFRFEVDLVQDIIEISQSSSLADHDLDACLSDSSSILNTWVSCQASSFLDSFGYLLLGLSSFDNGLKMLDMEEIILACEFGSTILISIVQKILDMHP